MRNPPSVSSSTINVASEKESIKPELNKIFKPAFLGRMVIVPYFTVRDEVLKTIIRLKLGKVQKRLNENHRIGLSYGDDLVNEVAARCTEVESGARNVDNILTNTLLPDISRQLLSRMASGEKLGNIHISVGDNGAFAYAYGEQPQPAELAPGD